MSATMIERVIAEQAKVFSFERKYKAYLERMEKGVCETCGLTGIKVFKEVGRDADGFPEWIGCVSCGDAKEQKPTEKTETAEKTQKKKVVLKIVKKLPAPAPAPAPVPEKKKTQKTKCDGCGSGDYGKGYIYSSCVTCGEEVCGWCSYDVVRENGQLCIRCGYGVSTPEEVEEIAKKMKCDPHIYTYTPTAKPKKTKKVRTYCFGCETDAGEPVVKCVDCDEDVCVECCGSSFPLNGKTAMKCIKCETLLMNDGGGIQADEGEVVCFICGVPCEPEDGEYVGDEDVVCNDCGMLREFDDVRDGWVATKWAIEKIMKYKRGGKTMSGAIDKVMAY